MSTLPAPLILVPVDFSACAPLLVDEAIRFARAFQAEILLLHTAELPAGLDIHARVHRPEAPAGDGSVSEVEEIIARDAAVHLGPLEAAIRLAGLRARSVVRAGAVVPTILGVCASEKARMIVMGTHGRTGWSRLAVGSVAEEVLRRSSVPVVTVRTQHRPACAAGSCATCSADRSAAEEALSAESQG